MERIKQGDKEVSEGEPIDIYELMIISIRVGIPLSEWKHLTFATLSNIIFTASESSKSKEPSDTRQATQDDIDRILG